MRPDEILARRLAAEILAEVEELHRLEEELRTAPQDGGTFSLRARGSILHDFYTGVERIFRRVAEELNGGVPTGAEWHRLLLKDMELELPGVRPRVVTPELTQQLDEYLRFRHLFRNVYGFTLKSERLQPLADDLPALLDRFVAALQVFVDWMTGDVGERDSV